MYGGTKVRQIIFNHQIEEGTITILDYHQIQVKTKSGNITTIRRIKKDKKNGVF